MCGVKPEGRRRVVAQRHQGIGPRRDAIEHDLEGRRRDPRGDAIDLGHALGRHLLAEIEQHDAQAHRVVGEVLKPVVARQARGRTHMCRLGPGPLTGAHRWLHYYERYSTDRLNRLEQLVLEEDAEESLSLKGDDQ